MSGAREHCPQPLSHWRLAMVALLGPATVLAGWLWAIAQPYRLTLLRHGSQGVWDQIVQPPLLVAAVGIVFTLAVARPLLREARRGQ